MTTTDGTTTAPTYALDEKQLAFFETFGFLRIPGLFAPEIDRLIRGFEAVFADLEVPSYSVPLHYGDPRTTIGPGFIDRHEDLSWLRTDHRVLGIVHSLIGDTYDYRESDGNIFSCETAWHCDLFGSPIHKFHLKLYFYLDELRDKQGAVRMIPGTNWWQSGFAGTLRRDLFDVSGPEQIFGVSAEEIPSWTIENDPGDVILGNFRTMHASFGGGERRRLMTVNFCAPEPPPED